VDWCSSHSHCECGVSMSEIGSWLAMVVEEGSVAARNGIPISRRGPALFRRTGNCVTMVMSIPRMASILS